MNYKKIGIFLGVAFVLVFLVSQPEESAGLVRDSLDGVRDAAIKLATFLNSLVR